MGGGGGFFFFKQKTAYEVLRSLVGSEMCIRDRVLCALPGIGLEKVQPIIEYTSSPAWALTWLTQLESEERIPGVGLGTKRAIRKALGLKDDQELSVVCIENGQTPKE